MQSHGPTETSPASVSPVLAEQEVNSPRTAGAALAKATPTGSFPKMDFQPTITSPTEATTGAKKVIPTRAIVRPKVGVKKTNVLDAIRADASAPCEMIASVSMESSPFGSMNTSMANRATPKAKAGHRQPVRHEVSPVFGSISPLVLNPIPTEDSEILHVLKFPGASLSDKDKGDGAPVDVEREQHGTDSEAASPDVKPPFRQCSVRRKPKSVASELPMMPLEDTE